MNKQQIKLDDLEIFASTVAQKLEGENAQYIKGYYQAMKDILERIKNENIRY